MSPNKTSSKVVINAYLGQVATNLRLQNIDGEEATTILDGLQEQIGAMVEEAVQAGLPWDIHEILGSLDGPDAFGAPTEGEPSFEQGALQSEPNNLLANLSLAANLLGPIAGIATGMGVSAGGWDGEHVGFLVFCALEAIALICGISSWSHRYAKVGAIGALALVVSSVIAGSVFG